MAQIRNLNLQVEKGSLKSKAKIFIQMDVDLSAAERRLSMHFGLFIGIYEGDYSQDMILPMANGISEGRIYNLDPKGPGSKYTQDDAIEVFYAGNLIPRRRRSMRVQLEREIQLKNRNVSKESFRVAAYVVPEISSGFAISNEVQIEPEESKAAKEKKPTVKKSKVAPKKAAEKKPSITKQKKSPVATSTALPKKTSTAKKPIAKKPITKKAVAPKKAVEKKPSITEEKKAIVAKPTAPSKTTSTAKKPTTATKKKVTTAKKTTTAPKEAESLKAVTSPKKTSTVKKSSTSTKEIKATEAAKGTNTTGKES